MVFLSLKIDFDLTISGGPNEMLHLGLHCLTNTRSGVSGLKKDNKGNVN